MPTPHYHALIKINIYEIYHTITTSFGNQIVRLINCGKHALAFLVVLCSHQTHIIFLCYYITCKGMCTYTVRVMYSMDLIQILTPKPDSLVELEHLDNYRTQLKSRWLVTLLTFTYCPYSHLVWKHCQTSENQLLKKKRSTLARFPVVSLWVYCCILCRDGSIQMLSCTDTATWTNINTGIKLLCQSI